MSIFRFRKQKLGDGFSDFLSIERKNFLRGNFQEKSNLRRLYVFLFCCLVAFIILGARLYYLTVVKGSYFRTLSSKNRLREVRIEAPRGVIYDRNGNILARNVPINKKCEEKNGQKYCSLVSSDKAIELEAKGLNNSQIITSLGREYPVASISAHAVGYMREVNENDLKKYTNYLPGDWFGATGAEKAFESRLKGIDGKRLIEVDAIENEVRELTKIEPTSGENIYLSIDKNLQNISAALLGGSKGVIIVSNPKNGEILALYSNPSYDPNVFVSYDKGNEIENLMNDQNQPLFNRAISGTYPPGSTFKIVTATAGLESGEIKADTLIEDTGIIRIGEFSFSNWYFSQYGKTEGEINIVKAIARSNDVFFYKLGEMVGEDELVNWSKKYKLGSQLGIELPGEESGNIHRERKLYLGDLYHLAIGQGDLLVTPLQVNSWSSIIANNGKFCKPTIERLKDSKTQRLKENCENLGISEKTINLIKEGMKEACSEGGTGWPLFQFRIKNLELRIDGKNFTKTEKGETLIPVACKTGTAEYGDPQNKTHAWMTAFAPVEDPEVAVTVLIEGGGEGSSVAGPLVKEILTEYFIGK